MMYCLIYLFVLNLYKGMRSVVVKLLFVLPRVSLIIKERCCLETRTALKGHNIYLGKYLARLSSKCSQLFLNLFKHILFFFFTIYLFGCIRSWLQHSYLIFIAVCKDL